MKISVCVEPVVKVSIILSLIFVLLSAQSVSAFAVSYLDPAYGPPQGFVSFNGHVNDSAIQSDDRMLLLKDGQVTRLLPDGSIDIGFGINGTAEPVFTNGAFITVSPDGLIIVADICWANKIILTRLLPDGKVDPSFHSICQSVQADYWEFTIKDIAVQANQKILVGAFNMYMGDVFWGYSIVARFEEDGDLDTSFASNGVIKLESSMGDFVVSDLDIQPDEKVLATGSEYSSLRFPGDGPTLMAVFRLTSLGQYDPSFNEDGVMIYDVKQYEYGDKIAVLENGRILIGGIEGPTYGGDNPIVLGLTLDGNLDPNFGDQGRVNFPDRLYDMVILLDNGFLTGGTVAETGDIAIRRFKEDGTAAPLFGNGGVITFDAPTFGRINTFHIQKNGQVLFQSNLISSGQSILARLDIDLTPHFIFKDVGFTHWAQRWIETIYHNKITAGCGVDPLIFCPDAPVTRAQMAVFLLRGKNGSGYVPPSATGYVFGDVSSAYWAASWIEQLSTDGITGGCGNGNYCPEGLVTRAQMSIFLLSAEHGLGYVPPAATGVFNDVPANYWAASWIEQLAAEGITGGCGNGNYCPDTPVTRAQMAVFLVKTFNLP